MDLVFGGRPIQTTTKTFPSVGRVSVAGVSVASASAARVSRGHRFIFLGVVVLVCSALSEAGLWIFAPVPPPYALAPNHPDVRGHNRYIASESPRNAVFAGVADPSRTPGIAGPVTVSYNEFGFRSSRLTTIEKPAGVTRIFCVGGSTTACLLLDDQDTWPEQLQRLLQARYPEATIDVVNAGVNASTTRNDINLIAQRVLAFEPDIIVMLAGFNDARIAQQPDYSPIRMEKASYRSDRYMYLYRKLKWMGIKELLSTSQCFRRLVYAKRQVGLDSFDQDESDVSGRALIYLRDRHARRHPGAMPASIMSPKPEYIQNLQTILGMCQVHDIDLILVTQPVIWQEDMPQNLKDLCWMGFSGSVAYEPGDLAEMMNRYNQAMLDFGEMAGIPLVDAGGRLPKDTTVLYDDCHFNVSGAGKLAGLVAEAIALQDIPYLPNRQRPWPSVAGAHATRLGSRESD